MIHNCLHCPSYLITDCCCCILFLRFTTFLRKFFKKKKCKDFVINDNLKANDIENLSRVVNTYA